MPELVVSELVIVNGIACVVLLVLSVSHHKSMNQKMLWAIPSIIAEYVLLDVSMTVTDIFAQAHYGKYGVADSFYYIAGAVLNLLFICIIAGSVSLVRIARAVEVSRVVYTIPQPTAEQIYPMIKQN